MPLFPKTLARPLLRAGLPLLASALCAPALALNILLTNDDGYEHPNIRALYQALRKDGHTVRIVAPWKDQSAKGGAFIYGVEVQAGRDSDPAYPDSHYVKTWQKGLCHSSVCQGQTVELEISGTPVMAVLYGLEKVLPEADLVISGPNAGHNLGFINHFSGTFNAALMALQRGIPALAVSADLKEKQPERVAALIARLMQQLDTGRGQGQPLLPKGLGLNINVPPSAAIKGLRLTEIGRYVPFDVTYVNDLAILDKAQAGRFGVAFKYAAPAEAEDAESEALWVAQGFVSISSFGAAPAAASAHSSRQLRLSPAELDRLAAPRP